MFRPIPWVGSFQEGTILRSSNPLEAVWRQIQRVGTVDNMSRIAQSRGHSPALGRAASLKVRQALELRQASREASSLTKPLLLYYSMLNLTRGVMLAHQGTFGAPSHGLSYQAGPSLLDCAAKVASKGTFRAFAEGIGVPKPDLDGKTYSLRDLFAVIPEMQSDFPLLKRAHASTVTVKVESFIGGPTSLRFYVPDVSEEDFRQNWAQMFPWMSDVCQLADAFTLRLNVQLQHVSLVAEFCRRYLIHDLRLRDTPFWYDHRVGGGVTLLQRLPAYIAAMFILSNVSRYEPEFLDDATSQLTDLAYFLSTFLDNAERFLPQLVLELLNGRPMFFE